MVWIIVLVLVGWAAVSVVVAVLASTIFRGARTFPKTIALPPEYIDLTDPATHSVRCAAEQPDQDTTR
jgi:hypothetical protein